MSCFVAAQANFRSGFYSSWMLIEKLLSFVSGSLLPHSQGGGIQDNLQALGRTCIQRKKSLLRLLFYIGCVYSNTQILIVELFLLFEFLK